jgi:hypothetical protein
MRYSRIVLFIIAPNTLPVMAQAQTTPLSSEAGSLLWKNAPLKLETKKAVSQQEFTAAANQQISLLAQIKSLRDTFRGTGLTPKRDLLARDFAGYKASLAFGQLKAPTLSGISASGDIAAGISANLVSSSLGTLEFGTNFRPRAITEALTEYDGTMTGKKQDVDDIQVTNINYLRARPLTQKNLELEFSAMQVARDEQVGKETQWKRGAFLGGKGKYKFGRNWQASGEWVRADLEAREARQKWNLSAKGPIAHPFGDAKAEIEWRETEAGFANFASENINGEQVGQVKITQGIKKGELSGQIQLTANERERQRLENILLGEEAKSRVAQSDANFQLKLTPNMSLKAQGKVTAIQTEKFAGDTTTEIRNDQFSLDESVQTGGDVGLEWKFSKELRMVATTGYSQSNQWRRARNGAAESEDLYWQQIQEGEENRIGLELRHENKLGALGVRYQNRERNNSLDLDTTNDWKNIETIRLEAERKLLNGLSLKTMLDVARERDTPWGDENSLARRFETRITLKDRARLDFSVRDGAALPSSLLSDSYGNPFGSIASRNFQTGDREFAARFNAGSAQNGRGLGFALEYARNQSGTENLDSWKVGLTFK